MELQDFEDPALAALECLSTYTQEDYVAGKVIYDSPTCWDCVCCNSDGVIAVAGKTSVHLYSPQIQHQYFFATSWIKIEFLEESNSTTTVSESGVAWLASHSLNENAMYLKQICWFEMPNQQPILFVLANTGQLFGFAEDSLSHSQRFDLDYITRTVKIQAHGFRAIISPVAFGESGDYILHDSFDVSCGRRNLLVSSSESYLYVWELTFTSDTEADNERTLIPHRRSSLDIATHVHTQIGAFAKIAISYEHDLDKLSVVCANRWGSCYLLTATGEDMALSVVRSIEFEGSLESLYLSSRLLLVVSSVSMLAIHRTAANHAGSSGQQQKVLSPHTKTITSIKSTYSSFIGRKTTANTSEESEPDCFVSCSLDGSIYWWRLPTTISSSNIVIYHQMHLSHAEFGYYGITADALHMVFFTIHRQPVQNDNSRDVQLNTSLLRPHMMLSYHVHYSLCDCNLHAAEVDELTVILTQASSLFTNHKKQITAAHVVLSLWLLFLEQKVQFARLPLPLKPEAIIAREQFIQAQQEALQQSGDEAEEAAEGEGDSEEKGEQQGEKLLNAHELNKARNKVKRLPRRIKLEKEGHKEPNPNADEHNDDKNEEGDEQQEEGVDNEVVSDTSDSEVSIIIKPLAKKRAFTSSSTSKKNDGSDNDDDIQSRASTVHQTLRYGIADMIEVLRDYMPPTFVHLAEIASHRLLQSCCRALCQLSSTHVAVDAVDASSLLISDVSVDAMLSSTHDAEEGSSMQKMLALCLLTHVSVLSFHQIAEQPLSPLIRQQVDDLQYKMIIIHAVQGLTKLNKVLSKDVKACPSLLQWTMLDRCLQLLSSPQLQHSAVIRTLTKQSDSLRQALSRKWKQQLVLLKDRCLVCNDIILFETNTASVGTCLSCTVSTERCPFTLMLATTAIGEGSADYHMLPDMIIACSVCKAATNMQLWKQCGDGEEVVRCPYCAVVMKQLIA